MQKIKAAGRMMTKRREPHRPYLQTETVIFSPIFQKFSRSFRHS
ncbi:hypothetical protein [Azospirillum argentinense]